MRAALPASIENSLSASIQERKILRFCVINNWCGNEPEEFIMLQFAFSSIMNHDYTFKKILEGRIILSIQFEICLG